MTLPADVLRIPLTRHHDTRGYFCESYSQDTLRAYGVQAKFIQDNEVLSARHVLRGLHAQRTQPQGKLIRVVMGQVVTAVVDIRLESPHFGQSALVPLSADQPELLWIPPGYAHGYFVLSEQALYSYKVTAPYHPQDEICLRWNDPDLALDWPIPAGVTPIVSDKDAHASLWRELFQS